MWLYWLVWREMMAKRHKKMGEAHDQEIPGKQQWNLMLLLRQQYWKLALRHTSDNKALRKCKLKIKTVSRDNSQFTAWEKPKGLSRKVQQSIWEIPEGVMCLHLFLFAHWLQMIVHPGFSTFMCYVLYKDMFGMQRSSFLSENKVLIETCH